MLQFYPMHLPASGRSTSPILLLRY